VPVVLLLERALSAMPTWRQTTGLWWASARQLRSRPADAVKAAVKQLTEAVDGWQVEHDAQVALIGAVPGLDGRSIPDIGIGDLLRDLAVSDIPAGPSVVPAGVPVWSDEQRVA
jgi:hypothetical protein